MKPDNLQTKIFLDSGDPQHTRIILEKMGFLDGQTTNPTLISKNSQVQDFLARGERFTKEEVFDFYKKVVTEISGLIPKGSVSIEVSADCCTQAEAMIEQGREMFAWIPNAHIKLPTTTEGLKAASVLVQEGIWVNMTLVFSQAQAAAIHAATRGALKGQVFVSPFDGRLDDTGVQGDDVIANIITMYREANSHVEVLAASIRDLEGFLYTFALGADIVTVGPKVLHEWAQKGMPVSHSMPDVDAAKGLAPVPYEDLDLGQDWQSFDIQHDLTEKGIMKFTEDWESIIKK